MWYSLTMMMLNDTTESEFVRFSDDDIIAALMGEIVTVNGPKNVYKLSYDAAKARNQFKIKVFVNDFLSGVLEGDENAVRLTRLV